MKNLYYTIVFLAVLLANSCTKDAGLIDTSDRLPVVESYLFSGQSLDSFRVTTTLSYLDTLEELQTLDDLDIVISDGTISYPLQAIGEGYYKNEELLIESGQSYEMVFDYEGEQITALTYVPEKKEASLSLNEISVEKIELGTMGFPTNTDPITVSWENTESDYYYVLIENIEEELEYINENVANFEFRNPGIRTQPEIIDGYNIDTRRSLQYFGTHQVIVFRVNPEYAALYATRESTSTSIIEPASNIENGLGIMTGVSSDTLYFEVNRL